MYKNDERKEEKEENNKRGNRSSLVKYVDHEAFVAGFVDEVCRLGVHAPKCLVVDCDEYLDVAPSAVVYTARLRVRESVRGCLPGLRVVVL